MIFIIDNISDIGYCYLEYCLSYSSRICVIALLIFVVAMADSSGLNRSSGRRGMVGVFGCSDKIPLDLQLAQMRTLKVTLGVVFLLLGSARSQSAGCNFSRNVVPGTVYMVESPGYSSGYLYPAGVQCLWTATCPSGYNCRIDCQDIRLPQSSSCSMDRLLISRSGDPQLTSADYYCGTGSLYNVVSTGQQLTVGLIAASNSPGGTFSCDLTAQPATSSPTPTCSCGYKKVNRIVGGEVTQPNEFPMMAGIVYYEIGEIKCGAVIISNQYVVTAAHCMINRSLNNTAVVVGEHDVSTGQDTSATQAFRIASITIHPQYTATNYQNDIAVVKIQGTITFSESVGPVCLPFKFVNTNFAGAQVQMLGWGTTSFGGVKSKVLRKVTVDCISQSQCQSAVPSVTSTQLCTYTPRKDACQDDSGGPLLYTDPSTRRLFNIGVISYGQFCGSGSPAINTRVTSYLNFILNAAPGNYCRA